MNILFSINHPAHVHFFKHAINHLRSMGNNVIITCRRKDITTELLNLYSLPHIMLSSEKNNISGVFIELIEHQVKAHRILRMHKINLALSIGGTFIALACKMLKVPLVVFTDTEFNFSNKVSFPVATIIATPSCYIGNLGSKHIRYNGYHELAYLHPNRFSPDESVLSELGIGIEDRFFLVRKTSGKAVENIGQSLMNNEELINLVLILESQGRVLLTMEGETPSVLQKNMVSITPHKIHSLLYYAHLFVGDSLTMFTEAALLGTPSISISSEGFLLGNFDEICKKYNLGFRFRSVTEALGKINELLRKSDLKKEWSVKRERLIAEKRDVTQFQIDLIASFNKVRKNIREFSC